ncbi:TolC family protein [Agriterribacter sp.]|uniref:TolC family protein n=1 Tax=Agriterribacter sp. TaxID=2821509 RepID=UPI002C551C93|nr:TolC family protein [Agriterribacter sp.]HTN05473.1 TolC family protein [Agriterribacter sp.]
MKPSKRTVNIPVAGHIAAAYPGYRVSTHIKRGLLLLVLVLYFFKGVKAQDTVKTLSLKEALQMALQANQTARKAKLDIENSVYQIDEVRAGALPQVNGSGNITYNPLLQQSVLPGDVIGQPGKALLVSFGQKWVSAAGISLTQSLFDQSLFTGLKAAKGAKEYYELNGQLAEEQVIELVATAYYNVLVQRQKIGVIDSTISNIKKSEAIIKGQYESGLGKQIDVDRIAVNIANLESQKLQLHNAVVIMENQLKYVTGINIRQPIQLSAVALHQVQPEALELQSTLDIDGRTEFQALKKQEELLHYRKAAYKAEYYPSLSLSGNYNYQGMGNRFPVFKGPNQGVNWFDYSSVGASLKIPLFNGGATRSRVRQADVSLRKLKEDMAQTSLALNLSFENAKIQINNSVIILNNQKKNVELAQKVYRNTQNNYNQGLAYLTDLLQSENAVTEAQNNYSAALLDYKLAEVQLIKAQGKLKTLLN